MSGTNHSVTTADNKIIHRKNICKPVSEITQEPNTRGTGPLGPDGRFSKSPRTFNIHDPDSESEDTESESPVAVTTKKSGTFGRGRPLKLDKKPVKFGLTRGIITNSPVTNHIRTNDLSDGKYDNGSCRPRY